MVAQFPIALQMAMDAERLTSGRGKELATQDTRIVSVHTRIVLAQCLAWAAFPFATIELTCADGTHGHEEHGEEPGALGLGSCADGVASGRYDHQDDDMDRAIVQPGRVPRDENRRQESRELE